MAPLDGGVSLRIAAGKLLAEQLMPEWLQALHDRYPGTRVSLRVSAEDQAVARHLRDGDADLGFVGGPYVPTDLHAQPIGCDRLVVVAAPAHPWTRRGQPLTGSDLARTRLVLRTPGSASRATVERALATWGGPRKPAQESDITAVLRHAAARNKAPAVLSALAVEKDIAAGRLVEIPVEPAVRLERVIHALWPRGTVLSTPARHLLQVSTNLLAH